MSEYEHIILALANNAPTKDIEDFLLYEEDKVKFDIFTLTEGKFDDEHRETQNFYTLLFEQYIDECHCYSFEGWSELKFIRRPTIEKYWIEFKLLCPTDFDFEGGKRRLIGKHSENLAEIQRNDSGKSILTVRLLRSILDNIEDENRRIARKEAEEQGLLPDREDEADEDPAEMMDGPF